MKLNSVVLGERGEDIWVFYILSRMFNVRGHHLREDGSQSFGPYSPLGLDPRDFLAIV